MARDNLKGRKFKCKKCDYTWESRKENPKACPSCKQYIKKGKQ
ncbi:MAG: hypothetical protein AABY22_22030 [Nanoarchaeota archaeon]